MPYTYKVKQDKQGNPLTPDGTIVPSIGVVKDGQIVSGIQFENPNFELVSDGQPSAHLNGVVPQSEQTAAPQTESEGKV